MLRLGSRSSHDVYHRSIADRILYVMIRQSGLLRRPKKVTKKSLEWKVEPVSSDRFQELGEVPGGELVATLAFVCARVRALEIEVFELRS